MSVEDLASRFIDSGLAQFRPIERRLLLTNRDRRCKCSHSPPKRLRFAPEKEPLTRVIMLRVS